MIKRISGTEFAALAIKRAKLKRCFAYDTPYIRHICEKLNENKVEVKLFDGIDRISSIMSMCESERSSTCFFIPQKYIALMEETKRFRNRRRKVFVVICDEDSKSTIEIIKALKLPVWIPVKTSDIYSMILEAIVFSGKNNEATAVAIPKEMLSEKERIEGEKLYELGYSYNEVASRLRVLHGNGEILIVTSGNATQKVMELTQNATNVRVIELRALILWRWHFPKKTIYIMPALDKKTPDEKYIRAELEKNLSSDLIKQRTPRISYCTVIKERNHYYAEDAAMCSGCIFRIKQCEYLDELGKGKIAVAQEIFCAKRLTTVSSAMQRSNVKKCNSLAELEMYHEENPQVRAVFFTNGKKEAKEGIDVVDVGNNGRIRMGAIKLIRTKCDACGKCLINTGCPAISMSGLVVNLSLKSCMGCALCARYCNRDALCLK